MRKHMTFLMIAMALAGCAKKAGPAAGPGASAPGSIPAAEGPAAKDLKIELLKIAERNPSVPAEEKFKGGLTAFQPVYSEQDLVLNSTINLNAGDRAAFTWPQGQGKFEIRGAVFAVRAERSDNQVTGTLTYESANWDAEKKRWFVPFDRMRRVQDFGPGDVQQVFLHLTFAGAEPRDYTISFHAAGPLMALVTAKDQQIAPAPTLGMFTTSGTIVNLRRLTVVNPMLRRVILWVKVDPSRSGPLIAGRLKLGGGPMVLSTDIMSQSHVSHVYVNQPDGQGRSIALSGWTPIRFEAGEALALDWQTTAGGCNYSGGDLAALMIDGTWAADFWLTDESVTAFAGDVRGLPDTSSLNAGHAVYSVSSRTGSWDGRPNSSAVCR